MKPLLLLVLAALPASAANNVRVNVQAKAGLGLPVSVVAAGQGALTGGLRQGALENSPSLAVQEGPKVQLENLTAELGGNSDGGSPQAALSKSYDKALEGDAGGSVVEAEASFSEKHAAAELAQYKAHAARFPNNKPVETITWGRRAWETAELGAYQLPFHLAAFLALGSEAWNPAVQALLWSLSGYALAQRLADLRSYVVGGWQASHDQKYRVGTDGRLRDVRGHKYGSDRYEEYARGPVSTREKLAIAAASAGSAVLWTLLGLN